MQRLIALYNKVTGRVPQCTPMAGAGSNRKYYRVGELVGVVGTSREENAAFIYLSGHFAAKGLPVPRVVAVSDDGLCYLQQDLGRRSLFDALRRGREAGGDYNDKERELLRRTIRLLPRLQVEGAEGLDFARCYPQPSMDRTNVLFDLNYFKYCFLKPSGTDFNEYRLEEEFQQMADELGLPPLGGGGATFLYRDFQARNVMLDADERPWFIDFQGGRRGPVHYDLASFLWQASARYGDDLREELIQEYLTALRQYTEVDEAEFRRTLQRFVLFRLLQVLGAYGFRGYFERKKHFLDSIEPALASLRKIDIPYPYLKEVITGGAPNLTGRAGLIPATTSNVRPCAVAGIKPALPVRLVVRVFSFSYKRGIPADESGNGGGYVFDCRAPHNPGRYEEYKHLTGLDEPVIKFLEDDGEITTFLESVYRLADAHVERYIERGFTHLMFSFGCTGGQHRSVYSAQHLAEHIYNKYGVRVELCHREQGISRVYSPAPKAMVFAAGLGTRLKPLTDTMPKALVPVGGRPLLQILLDKLNVAGFSDVVINVHHFADMIEEWCRTHDYHPHFSDERASLLETGGGIKHAAPLLSGCDRFLIHNVDILSNADLTAFYRAGEHRAATLLVSERQTQRYLLFDDDMRLRGWMNTQTGEVRSPFPDLDPARCRRLAFAGIHQMSTSLFRHFAAWPDRFSIIDFYLSLAASEPIYGYVQPGLRLMDVGKVDTLDKAEQFLNTL